MAVVLVKVLVKGGLQDSAAVAKHKELFKFTKLALLSRPPCQVALGLLLVLPPMGFARVAVSWCPSALLVHVALEWPTLTRYPCVQQYPFGSSCGLYFFLVPDCCMGCGMVMGLSPCALARSV